MIGLRGCNDRQRESIEREREREREMKAYKKVNHSSTKAKLIRATNFGIYQPMGMDKMTVVMALPRIFRKNFTKGHK